MVKGLAACLCGAVCIVCKLQMVDSGAITTPKYIVVEDSSSISALMLGSAAALQQVAENAKKQRIALFSAQSTLPIFSALLKDSWLEKSYRKVLETENINKIWRISSGKSNPAHSWTELCTN